MSSQPHIIIANWKMYFSYNQALSWCREHKQDLQELVSKNPFVVCPSYEALASLAKLFEKSTVSLGAQNCSEYPQGAYTGQVMAQSLSELGAKYCIIGHSETRNYLHETNEQLLHKMEQLLIHSLIPIICLGETKEDYDQNITEEKIEHQLEPLITLLKNNSRPFTCFIAYEPIWAIGTGIVADNPHINRSLTFIKKQLETYKGGHTLPLLYGGTVTSETIPLLKKIELIEGFLIGKATTNFQELKKIVLLLQES